MRLTFALLLALAATACTAGDDDDIAVSADASPVDPDATPATANALGKTCTTKTPCPTVPRHICVYLSSGNPDIGYCSPVCAQDIDCTAGYAGPGDPTCFTPADVNACSIVCDMGVDCPEGLDCIVTGGPVNVCATI